MRTEERVQLEIEAGNVELEAYGVSSVDVDRICEAPVKSIVNEQDTLLYELRLQLTVKKWAENSLKQDCPQRTKEYKDLIKITEKRLATAKNQV